MNQIIKDVLAFAPTNLNKNQTAQWIRAKYKFDWDVCHYHALQAMIARIELRIKEQFKTFLDVDVDDFAIRDLFDRSLGVEYDYACSLVKVDRCDESFVEILNNNLQISL
jgi:hypothetical protein